MSDTPAPDLIDDCERRGWRAGTRKELDRRHEYPEPYATAWGHAYSMGRNWRRHEGLDKAQEQQRRE